MTDILRGMTTVLRSSWKVSRYRFLISVVLMLLGALSGPLTAVFLGGAVDAALDGMVTAAVWLGVAVAAVVLLSLTMEHFAHIFFSELAGLHQISIERELGRSVQGAIGMEHHERQDFADRMQLLRKETVAIGDGVQSTFTALVLVAQITLTAVLLARVEPWLLILPLFALPPLVAGRLADARVERAELAAAPMTRLGWHLQRLAIDAVAAKEIRLFGLQRLIRDRQRAALATVDRAMRRPELTGLGFRVASQVIYAAGYVGAMVLVVRAAIDGERTVGDVVLLLTLAVQTNAQAAGAVAVAKSLQRNARALAWLRWLHKETEQSPSDDGPKRLPPDRITDGIEFTQVSFRYPGTTKDVLADFSITLPAGSTVAVVGENGAGKSTLIKLLCRFYEPTGGRISVDGVNLLDLDSEEWRRRTAAGFQDFARLSAPAWESIGIGDLHRANDRPSVWAAVHRADAAAVIDRLPAGLDTQLGKEYEDGDELSGGQWQRIALSRAMMRSHPLLMVLDEPTSALDPLTEHALFDRYSAAAHEAGRQTGGITILVSHRFSTVRMADIILVMADGRVAEAGDHESLMDLGGTYAELFRLQAGAYR